ncbi:MAG: hypothetical protein AAF391_12300 [Bacteroidota bacterium]
MMDSNIPFVSADKNLKAIADNLSIAGNQDYTVRKFNNINHIFQDSESGSPAHYNANETTFSSRALQFLVSWLESVL